MIIKKLVKLSDAERAEAVRHFNDINAGDVIEDRTNRDVRAMMLQMAVILEVALKNREDEDCQRFLIALREAVQPSLDLDDRPRHDSH